MNKLTLVIIALSLLVFANCTNKKATTDNKFITVYAAASLTDVITEISDSFKADYGIDVRLNLASSGTLARQIEQGERPNVYLSASKKWADYVEESGFTLPNYKKEIMHNELVLIAPNSSALSSIEINPKTDISSLLGDDRLSIGDPAHVPAGKYAQGAIDFYGWTKQVEGKLLPAKDVRSALMVVELGEVPLGIVYRTDALKSKKVKIVGSFGEESHKPIQYIASVIAEEAAGKDFYNFLTSEKVRPVWNKYGFKE